MGYLEPNLRYDVLVQSSTAKEMFECLEADGDPNRKQNAGNKSQAIKQGHRGFNGFSRKFKLLQPIWTLKR